MASALPLNLFTATATYAPGSDSIGTPCGVTIDFQTLEDNTVTLRDRDTMQQVRVSIDELESLIADRVRF
jgi:glycyl-tRNA synthetase